MVFFYEKIPDITTHHQGGLTLVSLLQPAAGRWPGCPGKTDLKDDNCPCRRDPGEGSLWELELEAARSQCFFFFNCEKDYIPWQNQARCLWMGMEDILKTLRAQRSEFVGPSCDGDMSISPLSGSRRNWWAQRSWVPSFAKDSPTQSVGLKQQGQGS